MVYFIINGKLASHLFCFVLYQSNDLRLLMIVAYSLPMIEALLGHTQAQTTLRYAHLATDHLRKAAEDISNAIAASTPKLPEPPAQNIENTQVKIRLVK
jgi:hypothetical protein